MFTRLLARLSAPEPEQLNEADARHALGALLVRIARADEQYDEIERARIQNVLATRYSLSPADAVQLCEEAEALEAQAPDTVRFTRAIKEAVPHEQRLGVIEAMWSIVLTDGARDPREDALLRLLSKLLGISDRDSALARQRVSS